MAIPTTGAGRGFCKSNLVFQVREKSGKCFFKKKLYTSQLFRIFQIISQVFKNLAITGFLFKSRSTRIWGEKTLIIRKWLLGFNLRIRQVLRHLCKPCCSFLLAPFINWKVRWANLLCAEVSFSLLQELNRLLSLLPLYQFQDWLVFLSFLLWLPTITLRHHIPKWGIRGLHDVVAELSFDTCKVQIAKKGTCRSNKNTTFALQLSHTFSISSSATPTWPKYPPKIHVWYNLEHWHTPLGCQLQSRIQRGLGQGCLEKAECNISSRKCD